MKILVLGGTGAMGVPLVKELEMGQENLVYVTSRQTHQNGERVFYLKGNARDNDFLNEILSNDFDIIIDFMNYNLDEYEIRLKKLLSSCKHYIWTSSSRVYANSENRLSESSPRLLETSTDKDFLATNRYALRKARQEDLITNSGFNNYTIIRPYITYNDERLQMGICEKEQWLYRLIKNKPLVLSEAMLGKETTLTFGNDVAHAIAKLVGKDFAKGQIYQIASSETIRWIDLLIIYSNTLKDVEGVTPTVYSSRSISAIEMLYEGGYNSIYDRFYDRSFDSSKINQAIGEKIEYRPTKEGIKQCLENFLNSDRRFLQIDPVYEAYQDLLTNCQSSRDDFSTEEEWETYKAYRSKPISEIEGLEYNIQRISL